MHNTDPNTTGTAAAPGLPTPEQAAARLPAFEHQHLSEAQIASLVRLAAYAQSKGITSFGALERATGISSSTFSKLFSGKYGTSNPYSTIAKIDKFLSVEERRQDLGVEPIVSTHVTRDIASFAELIRESNTIGLLWGKSHVGKTTGLTLYADATADTVYARTPAGGGTRITLEEIVGALGLGTKTSYGELRDKVMRRIGRNTLLIIDEFHQVQPHGRSLQTVTCELIREIHDRTKCGILLAWTIERKDLALDALFAGPLKQLFRRGVLRQEIPEKPEAADLREIRKAYGFPELKAGSEEHQEFTKLVAAEALGFLCKTLRMARALSVREGRDPAWADFLATVSTNRVRATGQLSTRLAK